MKLLKVCFDHLTMFEDGLFDIDLFASDRVTASDESAFELADHLYVNSVVALAGINATGKTTALNLLELACRIVDGSPARGGGLHQRSPPRSTARPSSSASYGTQIVFTCSSRCCRLSKEATTVPS